MVPKDLERKASSAPVQEVDAQSETMSTSTVSRVEEQSRMADIEASFEDRCFSTSVHVLFANRV